jgi:glyoxylase-like metal-dependent hydrolase (beta-lactamase superfamily II)
VSAIKLGEVTIDRVVEIWRSSFPTAMMLPESTPEAIAAHHDWLKPHFFDDAVGDLGSRIQTYVLRTPTRTILVDTGVGNDKRRDGSAAWHLRRGSFLADLAALGVTPESVDLVLCTHMHVDHVGWNTRLVGERWVPTFPNARYVFCGAEWEFWRHEHEAGREEYGCVADSVVPIVEAGLARFVQPDERLDEGLRFEPAPGHTPGHVVLRLTTPGGDAVFSGDLMHRTVQVAEPRWNSRFCYDGPGARATREAFVEHHADTGTLVLAAHFPVPGCIVTERGRRQFTPVAGA